MRDTILHTLSPNTPLNVKEFVEGFNARKLSARRLPRLAVLPLFTLHTRELHRSTGLSQHNHASREKVCVTNCI